MHERFPEISAACRHAGLDLARDRIPVGPAAHYMMGGVWTDLSGRTSIRDLFAAGEVACTGVHGANRLASNSLLEGLVFGGRAGDAMRDALARPSGHWPVDAPSAAVACPPPAGPRQDPVIEAADVKNLMWRCAGLFRDQSGTDEAARVLDPAWEALRIRRRSGSGFTVHGWQTSNLITIARLIARAARRRQESRGGHYRTDFPERDDLHWKKQIFETLETEG